MAAQLLELFHCSKSLFDHANFTRTRGITRNVECPCKIRVWITNGCQPTNPNQAGPTQLNTWFGSLNCCVKNLSQVAVISFWRKGSRRLNATERAGLWIDKTNQFSKKQHRNCLRAMKVRVDVLVYCWRQNHCMTNKIVLPLLPVLTYSTGTGWIDNRKEQQHTTQHEPFLPSQLFQTENTRLTLSSVFTTNLNQQHCNCLRATKVVRVDVLVYCWRHNHCMTNKLVLS